MTVHAPYHFVPLSKWVFLPKWAHLVSHDLPFKDGICGSIQYTLTNSSPLLVGGHHKKEADDSTTVKWAQDPDGQPIIPGSSIKGMLRSVMEIATFSKLGIVDDKAMSFRDFGNDDYKNNILNDTIAKAAWIKFDTNMKKWTIKFVDHSLVFDTDLNAYNKENTLNHTNIHHGQSAVEKYTNWDLETEIKFKSLPKPTTNDKLRRLSKDLGTGNITGNLVFTDPRIGAEKADKEYLRFNYLFHQNNTDYKPVEKIKLIDDYLNFHDQKLIEHLKANQHKEYGIPVFVRAHGMTIKAIGVAKLPKIAYYHTTKELISNQQKLYENQASFDLPECIFGTLREKGMSLKSRVSFSDAKKVKLTGYTSVLNKVLVSPRESYLAAYIDGKSDSEVYRGYNTLDNKIKGIKVYPRNKHFNKTNDTQFNDKMLSKLKFLNKGSQFKGTIHFHNLKPEELGSLLWSITYGENENCYHGLGHAKPYGAGNVQVKIDSIDANTNDNSDSSDFKFYVERFESYMEQKHYAGEWLKSPQIQHLISFAQPSSSNLTYMDLENGSNSFKANKRQKNTLPDWKDRSESDANIDEIPSSYAKGRLSELIDEGNQFDKIQFQKYFEKQEEEIKQKEEERKQKEKEIKQLEIERIKEKEREIQREIEADKKGKPSYYADMKDIESKFDTCLENEIPSIHNEILIMINNANGANPKWEDCYAQQLYQLMQNDKGAGFISSKAPNKKKKKAWDRYHERIGPTNDFKKKYNIS